MAAADCKYLFAAVLPTSTHFAAWFGEFEGYWALAAGHQATAATRQ